MPIAEPPADLGLWPAVQQKIRGWGGADGGWVPVDEDGVRALAATWTDGGVVFGSAVQRGGRPAGFVGPVPVDDPWADRAGFEWTTRRLALGADVAARGREMDGTAARVTAFADIVTYAKEQIVATIRANLEGYGQVDAGQRDAFVTEVARAIDEFLTAMADLIGAGGGGERPELDVNGSDPAGWGAEEWADAAGVASAALSVAALAFPPGALVLGGLSLATGAFALAQHSNEFYAEPTGSNLTTVAGDAVSLVPGVGAVTRLARIGGDAISSGFGLGAAANQVREASADAFGSTAPIWTRTAEKAGIPGAPLDAVVPTPSHAQTAGTVLQGATTTGTQVPTVDDLTGGDLITSDVPGQVSTEVYVGGRVAEAAEVLGRAF